MSASGAAPAGENMPGRYQALVTVGAAFIVSAVVLLVAAGDHDPGVLPSLIAPLVAFLPGALLTTGVVELATGHMMSGAGRLAAGVMQLALLAAGITAGAAVVGVPALELTGADHPLGAFAPWLAVAVFGVGIVVRSNGRPGAIGWVLLVLYVAYGAQVLADIFLGGVLSAFVGAMAMTPVAALVARQPSGPAAFVSFLPAFWLLVPGALGLVGVANHLPPPRSARRVRSAPDGGHRRAGGGDIRSTRRPSWRRPRTCPAGTGSAAPGSDRPRGRSWWRSGSWRSPSG